MKQRIVEFCTLLEKANAYPFKDGENRGSMRVHLMALRDATAEFLSLNNVYIYNSSTSGKWRYRSRFKGSELFGWETYEEALLNALKDITTHKDTP
jgi:hypothetical protein